MTMAELFIRELSYIFCQKIKLVKCGVRERESEKVFSVDFTKIETQKNTQSGSKL